MSTVAVVVGCVLAYLLVGVVLARLDLPRVWRRSLAYNERRFSVIAEQAARTDAQILSALTVLFWPVRLPAVAAKEVARPAVRAAVGVVDASNPRESERRAEAARARSEVERAQLAADVARLEAEKRAWEAIRP